MSYLSINSQNDIHGLSSVNNSIKMGDYFLKDDHPRTIITHTEVLINMLSHYIINYTLINILKLFWLILSQKKTNLVVFL